MVWARIDDAILDNPKIVRAGVYGFAMHVAAISWCCRNLTDGKIPTGAVIKLLTLQQVAFQSGNSLALVDVEAETGSTLSQRDTSVTGDEITRDSATSSPSDSASGDRFGAYRTGLDPLVVANHLVSIGLWTKVSGGYEIHDFLAYNPSKLQVYSKRKKATKRQRSRRSVKGNLSRRDSRVTDSVTGREQDAKSRVTSRLPDPDPLTDLNQKGDLDHLARGARDAPPTETPVRTRNAMGDGAFGMAVDDFRKGIMSVTRIEYDLPTRGSMELSKLVNTIVGRCPNIAERQRWAFAKGAEFARAVGPTGRLNVHAFVDWLNNPGSAGGPRKVAPLQPPPGHRDKAWKVGSAPIVTEEDEQEDPWTNSTRK